MSPDFLQRPRAATRRHRAPHRAGRRALRQQRRIDDVVLCHRQAAAAFAPMRTPAAMAVIRFAQAHFPGVLQAGWNRSCGNLAVICRSDWSSPTSATAPASARSRAALPTIQCAFRYLALEQRCSSGAVRPWHAVGGITVRMGLTNLFEQHGVGLGLRAGRPLQPVVVPAARHTQRSCTSRVRKVRPGSPSRVRRRHGRLLASCQLRMAGRPGRRLCQ